MTRAISIKQPFVELILAGKKRYEYRTVGTNIRERVYLYASAKPRTEPRLWRAAGKTFNELATGLILGSVEIIDCRPHAVHGYRYFLVNPERLQRPLRPSNKPSPIFWRPQFADQRRIVP